MSIQKYSVNQHPIQTILSWVNSGEIAIPEIQRPFVWSASKVRDLIDSLYKGYPVGYIIAWRNPNIRLKDGSTSSGKRILIDGQQRVTALMAALLGSEIIDVDYKRTKIAIAFNPLKEEGAFEVCNPAILKDPAWISDIAILQKDGFKLRKAAQEYAAANTGIDEDKLYEALERLQHLVNNPIGLIELNSDLDIETVTDIFIRINSQGATLNQADFAMSKIASNEAYGGQDLRKAIDYFCHLAIAPDFYRQIVALDYGFTQTDYFRKMAWLKDELDDLYDPSYTDMLRVSFTSEFKRGKLQDLVALLSGRNFETRTFEENIAEDSFARLKNAVFSFMNENHFKTFVMIIRSAGFIAPSMIRSQNTINFAYIVYLMGRSIKLPQAELEPLVRRWFVMSILTGRYSASPESSFDFDVRQIHEKGIKVCLEDIEKAELSEAFWTAALPLNMDTSVASSPYFNVYLASQVKSGDQGFLSRDIAVADLITLKGDVHHLFPKAYLKKHNLKQGQYNQIANFVMMQSDINIAVKDRSPAEYFSALRDGIATGKPAFGGIANQLDLEANFAQHCLPDAMHEKVVDHFEAFLQARRKLMAQKIKNYYGKL
jgi:hypothetical protein